MVNANKIPPSKRAKNMPSPRDKDQYHSLLNDSDSGSHLETIHTYSKQRPWHSVNIYVSAILFFIIGIILVAGLSISLIQLRSILSQIQDQLPTHKSVSVVPISPLPTPDTMANKSKPTRKEFGHCGHSIKEARALGCIFDPMSSAWQRPECYNTELVNDFLAAYDWHFFPNAEPRPSEELPHENGCVATILVSLGHGHGTCTIARTHGESLKLH